MKYLLRNLEGIVDFFEKLEQRLQEHVDEALLEEALLNQEAEDILKRATTAGEKAQKAAAIKKSLPNVN